MISRLLPLAALSALSACTAPTASAPVTIHTLPEWEEALLAFVAFLPIDARLEVSDDPTAAAATDPDMGLVLAVEAGLDCAECYRLDGEGLRATATASDLLGAQYGLADLLEQSGLRFLHPFDSYAPDTLLPLPALAGVAVIPEIATRGLHLHTLHPIEALPAFWMPEEGDTTRAEQVLDWVVKNRGNAVQWVALDDIISDSETAAAWQAHTRTINDAAHTRGLRTGLGIQLFGTSNLQRAFDLLDDPGTPEQDRAAIAARLSLVTDVGFDHLSLSFGEFFDAEPQAFVDAVDLVWEVAREQQPDVTMSTTIHVGDEQTVTWKGEEMIYYFLAQFADDEVVPWVHTVMFYDLFEPTGGSYHHEEFDQHRAFLLERIAAGEPVGYHPESAYWVAFDNPVPLYLPLYLRSRWLDLDTIRQESGGRTVDAHSLFSTGWEWGYWLNDTTTLRMTHTLRTWQDEVAFTFAPWGTDGTGMAQVIEAVAEREHQAFIDDQLTAWMAGRDAVMDVGYLAGIVSQPERPTLADVWSMDEAERLALETAVVAPLGVLALDLEPWWASAELLARRNDNRWFREVRDGVAVTTLRARFVHAVWAGALASARGNDPNASWTLAEAAMADAQTVVARRGADWHDPQGERWVAPDWDNPTIYDYGYLVRADELCFWERELLQARLAADGKGDTPPGCAL